MLDWPFQILFFIFGAVWGSFSNVIIVRLPANESVILPKSHCRSCKKPIAWYFNIPLISWLILKGKCLHCKAPIPPRYFLVELLTAISFLLVYREVGLSYTAIEYCIFVWALIVISFIDLDHRIIPDSFSLTGIVIGLLGAWLNPERQFTPALYGVLLGGGFLWLIAWLYLVIRKEDGMGGGDIKLIAWIGAVLGWTSIPFVILVSSILGSIVGLLIAFMAKKKGEDAMKTAIPFGPFLSLAAILFMFGGKELAMWYLRFFFPWL